MSRQLRGERDHVSRCDLLEQRDLRRDLRDLVRDDRERHGSVRHHRDEYLDYDHHPTAASTSALTNNPNNRADKFYHSPSGRFTTQQELRDLRDKEYSDKFTFLASRPPRERKREKESRANVGGKETRRSRDKKKEAKKEYAWTYETNVIARQDPGPLLS